MLNVEYGDKIISVESEYNPMFVRKARALHGKCNKPAWEFDASMKGAVRKALMDCYGDDGMSKADAEDVVRLFEGEGLDDIVKKREVLQREHKGI